VKYSTSTVVDLHALDKLLKEVHDTQQLFVLDGATCWNIPGFSVTFF